MSITHEPIPPEALQKALSELSVPGKGQTWLARQLGVNDRTVRRWISGKSKLSGASATAVRMLLKEAKNER